MKDVRRFDLILQQIEEIMQVHFNREKFQSFGQIIGGGNL